MIPTPERNFTLRAQNCFDWSKEGRWSLCTKCHGFAPSPEIHWPPAANPSAVIETAYDLYMLYQILTTPVSFIVRYQLNTNRKALLHLLQKTWTETKNILTKHRSSTKYVMFWSKLLKLEVRVCVTVTCESNLMMVSPIYALPFLMSGAKVKLPRPRRPILIGGIPVRLEKKNEQEPSRWTHICDAIRIQLNVFVSSPFRTFLQAWPSIHQFATNIIPSMIEWATWMSCSPSPDSRTAPSNRAFQSQ